jgi:iron complex transport system ATP-binding protein
LALVSALPVTTVVALHDLNLAATFCDEVVVLRRGAVVAAGTPIEVLTTALIADVYEVDARTEVDP